MKHTNRTRLDHLEKQRGPARYVCIQYTEEHTPAEIAALEAQTIADYRAEQNYHGPIDIIHVVIGGAGDAEPPDDAPGYTPFNPDA